MRPRKIRTKWGYNRAVRRVEKIFDAKKGTPEFDELNHLADVIEAYEEKKYPTE